MTSCPSCNTEVQPGTRWCGLCRANVVNPAIGRLASPGKRLGAYCLDVIAPVVVAYLSLFAAGADMASETDTGVGLFIGIGLLIAYATWALVLFVRGTTPGKNLLGMRVVKENGDDAGFVRMLIREWVGKWISGLFFFLGFLWILLDRDKQGWHDKLMSTYVVDQISAGEKSS